MACRPVCSTTLVKLGDSLERAQLGQFLVWCMYLTGRHRIYQHRQIAKQKSLNELPLAALLEFASGQPPCGGMSCSTA